VTAPPKLAELARIEQARDASGLFPLMLTATGAILTAPVAASESDTVAAAMRAAEGLIARHTRIPQDERARIGFYLAEVQRAGTGLLDVLPGDLLFPTGQPITQSEPVALPDGLMGEFTFRYAAVRQPDAPWLARAERQVESRIGATQRTALETWMLAPAGA
jgi:hypothetical protein